MRIQRKLNNLIADLTERNVCIMTCNRKVIDGFVKFDIDKLSNCW
jgi:hypothetical protein